MAWLLLMECTRAMAYFHSDSATEQGAFWHGDVHAGNIFLHFEDQKNPKVLFGDFGSSEYQYCAKAVDNGEGLIGDVGYIWEMDYRCCKLGTNPPIPESMRQFLNLDLHLQGVNSGQQFLESIEGLAAERMAFLQTLPGFSIPKPQAYDVPRLWRSPVITGKHSEILNQLPQQPDGEPG